MAAAARSPEFSHPTEMPRGLAGWRSISAFLGKNGLSSKRKYE
jgi:hypothetical protein